MRPLGGRREPRDSLEFVLGIRKPLAFRRLGLGSASLGSGLLGGHAWQRDEVWKKYIEDQKPEVPDDHFNVV